MAVRIETAPDNFDITVCEAVYPTGMPVTVVGEKFKLPVVKAKVEIIAFFGDSRCKPTDQTSVPQQRRGRLVV